MISINNAVPAAAGLEAARRVVVFILLVAALLGAPRDAAGQPCPGGWLPGEGLPGVDGQVRAALRLANGDVIVGGQFVFAGSVRANNIARYRPSTGEWFALGPGVNGAVLALAQLPSGDVVAGGFFTHAGKIETPRIARWNGSEWFALGTGLNSGVRALAVLPNGHLVAGGDFTATSGGTGLGRIGKWNGVAWSPLGTIVTGSFNGEVHALAVLPNGDLIAGGAFTSVGELPAARVARWDGSAWSGLGAGIGGTAAGITVYGLAPAPGGGFIAGGTFATAGGAPAANIARWNGSAWSAVGGGISGAVQDVLVQPNGDILATGAFTMGESRGVARWNGSTWSGLSTGINGAAFAVVPLGGGDVFVAGEFTQAGNVATSRVARWNDASGTWMALGNGLNGTVYAMTRLPNGELVVGGSFVGVAPHGASYIARRVGNQWLPLGPAETAGLDGAVLDLEVLPNGDLLAAGWFRYAGGVPVGGIARWNGSTWTGLGSGVPGVADVRAVAVLGNGDIVAGGRFSSIGGVSAANIARWNGSTWAPIGAGVNDVVLDIVPVGPTAMYVAGHFSAAGGMNARGVALWTGSTWVPLVTSLVGWVNDITLLPGGDLVAAGGDFSSAGEYASAYFAQWVPGCPPDWNCNGALNSADIAAFLTAWLGSINAGTAEADFDGNGVVNSTDISAFLAAWLEALQDGC